MRRVLLIAYASIVVLMLLFPPTIISTTSVSVSKALEVQFPTRAESAGFRFIGAIGAVPDKQGQVARSLSMDFRQLGVQMIVVTLAAGACLLTLRRPEKS